MNAVIKRKDSNCVGILCDQREAATASNLSEHTISDYIYDEIKLNLSLNLARLQGILEAVVNFHQNCTQGTKFILR